MKMRVPKWKPRMESEVLSLMFHWSWVLACVQEDLLQSSSVGSRELTPGRWQARVYRDETFRHQACRLQSWRLAWHLVYVFCILLLSMVSLLYEKTCHLVCICCVTLVKSTSWSCKEKAIKGRTVCFSCSCTCVNNETRTEDSAVDRGQRTEDRGAVISQETSAAGLSPGRRQEVREGNMRILFLSAQESCFESNFGSFHQQPGETLSSWGAGIKAVGPELPKRWYLMKIRSYFIIPGLDICIFIGLNKSQLSILWVNSGFLSLKLLETLGVKVVTGTLITLKPGEVERIHVECQENMGTWATQLM